MAAAAADRVGAALQRERGRGRCGYRRAGRPALAAPAARRAGVPGQPGGVPDPARGPVGSGLAGRPDGWPACLQKPSRVAPPPAGGHRALARSGGWRAGAGCPLCVDGGWRAGCAVGQLPARAPGPAAAGHGGTAVWPSGDRLLVEGLPPAGTAAGDTEVAGRAAGGPGADGPAAGPDAAPGGGSSPAPGTGAGGDRPGPVLTARVRALQVELAPPPSSVARSLRLGAGEPVAMVTAGFEDQATGRPVAITTAMLRPDLFRIVIQATAQPTPAGLTDGMAAVWTHDMQGWEP